VFGGPPPEFVVTCVVEEVPPEALPVGVLWTLMLVWVLEVEPVEPPVCVVEPVDVPLPCVVAGLDVPVPVPVVLLPVLVVGVVLVGGTILCWFVGTVVLVVEPEVAPVLEPCEG